jgi:cytochrome c biogenesis protein
MEAAKSTLGTEPSDSKSESGRTKRLRTTWSVFSSVKLTVLLLSLIAFTVLLGAWCPQESQVGQEKVLEQFGTDFGTWMIKLGISDIFHTPFFLTLIALLTINLVVASWQRVFPRLWVLRNPLPFLGASEIMRLPVSKTLATDGQAETLFNQLNGKLKRNLYFVRRQENALVAESGKIGRLAPTVTHIGLLTLLLGVTISSWTGFSGFKPVLLGTEMFFGDSEHSKLWIGKLPSWHIRVDSTRRENYESGEAKQWYSRLTVIDQSDHVVKSEEISVNNPLTYEGVDIYQSSWGLDQIQLAFNGQAKTMSLRPMGKLYAAFLPLTKDLILIFSVHDQESPMRVFAKRPDWDSPKLLGEIALGRTLKLGAVQLMYGGAIPVTGLQYKCDPGLVITYTAFGFIMLGVCLASIPHRQIWAAITPDGCGGSFLFIGGSAKKGKILFQKQMDKIVTQLQEELPGKTNEALPENSYGSAKDTINV